jgi:hypothetical protein
MKKEINLDQIRSKALDMVDSTDEKDMVDFFANQYEDIVENTDDYIATGIVNQFYLNKEEEE